MAAAGISISDNPPMCCICLDVFTEPVTLQCGHDFCCTCITKYWDNACRRQCPLCKKCFTTSPGLRVNTLKSALTDQVRELAQETACCSHSEQQLHAGEVLCDVCTEKAQKSCHVCLSSYCKTHLVLHLNMLGLRRHSLLDPVDGMEDKMCKKYLKASQKLDNVFSKLSCKTTSHENL